MSVLKMILADDQYFISGELHGSRAELVYATCSRSPGNLNELNNMLKESADGENLRQLFGCIEGLDIQPVDAGLIIVDLAKKWIYAKDSYFGAHRRGRYRPFDNDEASFEYEFSDEWQFVAEAKYFRYLQSSELTPYFKLYDYPYNFGESEEFISEDSEILMNTEPAEYEGEDEGSEERSSIEMKYVNRMCSLIDLKAEDEIEKRDIDVLEHIIKYDQNAEVAQYRIGLCHDKIAALQIELQAVENLWKRTDEPRWDLKRIHFQARIGQQEKSISRLEEEHSEAKAMAVELRNLVVSEKFRNIVKNWKDHTE